MTPTLSDYELKEFHSEETYSDNRSLDWKHAKASPTEYLILTALRPGDPVYLVRKDHPQLESFLAELRQEYDEKLADDPLLRERLLGRMVQEFSAYDVEELF